MKRVYIETYGCQMNVADTGLLYGVLREGGFEKTSDPAEADVMLVNTCAIRENAEQRVVGRIGELKRHKRTGDVLGVVGCMAQRLGDDLLEGARHVDLVVGPDGYSGLGDLIAKAMDGERPVDVEFKSWEHYEDVAPLFDGGVTAFVTVQRGCDHKCTFCIVPMTRGPERSRKLSDVVGEVLRVAEAGTTEVTLLGQTVNNYNDGVSDFGELLRAVGDVDGIRRLRFTSPHPNDFSENVMRAMGEVPEVCEHVHLPLQSGSSRVLKRMLRRYTREDFLRCAEGLRKAVPGIALTTDIIVGFPGETDDDFEETMSLVREIEFDDAFTFIYSVREGTPAEKLPDRVDPEVAGPRLQRLIEEVRAIGRKKNVGLVGDVVEVLYEKKARRGELLQGRTRSNKVVLVEKGTESIGEYEHVRITGTTGSTFTGVPSQQRRQLTVV
jgi:tRNA-2-methylthio-N6-dimethylallyladenosine synthase